MPSSDLDLSALASYLHMTPQQVLQLASRDKIPGRKVAGEWRFNKAEIHHWLEARIGLSDHEELKTVERGLKRTAGPHEQEHVLVADLLHPEAVALPLNAKTRNSVIRSMADLAMGTGLLWDPKKMADALLEREELHPTALDNGVALLHPRRPMPSILGDSFIALGITSSGIPFGGGMHTLTDVFFLICAADDRLHLRILARLSRLLTAPGFLDRLREAPDGEAVRQLILEAEEEFYE